MCMSMFVYFIEWTKTVPRTQPIHLHNSLHSFLMCYIIGGSAAARSVVSCWVELAVWDCAVLTMQWWLEHTIQLLAMWSPWLCPLKSYVPQVCQAYPTSVLSKEVWRASPLPRKIYIVRDAIYGLFLCYNIGAFLALYRPNPTLLQCFNQHYNYGDWSTAIMNSWRDWRI